MNFVRSIVAQHVIMESVLPDLPLPALQAVQFPRRELAKRGHGRREFTPLPENENEVDMVWHDDVGPAGPPTLLMQPPGATNHNLRRPRVRQWTEGIWDQARLPFVDAGHDAVPNAGP